MDTSTRPGTAIAPKMNRVGVCSRDAIEVYVVVILLCQEQGRLRFLSQG